MGEIPCKIDVVDETMVIESTQPVPKICAPISEHDAHCRECIKVEGIVVQKGSNCTRICGMLPEGKTQKDVKAVRLFVKNETDAEWIESKGEYPDIGLCKWFNVPQYLEGEGLWICGSFKNWSHTASRHIKMEVKFK